MKMSLPQFKVPRYQAIAIGAVSVCALAGLGLVAATGKLPSVTGLILNKPSRFVVYSGQKMGYMDQSGQMVISPQFDTTEQSHTFADGLAAVKVKNQWGYIDSTGKFMIQPQYDLATPFSDGIAAVVSKETVSYIDSTRRVVFTLPAEQGSSFSRFSEGFAPVKLGDRWGYIDRAGKFAINPQFDAVGVFSDGLAMIILNGKVGYIDSSGKIIITPQFEDASKFSQGIAPIRVNEKWGFIDKTGKTVISPQFDELQITPEAYGWVGFTEGLTAVRVGKHWGFIDTSGKLAIAPQFEAVRGFSEGLAASQFGNRWGYIDKAGKIMINPQYDTASDFTNGLAFVSQAQSGYIDRTGKFVWQTQNAKDLSPQQLTAQSTAKTTLGSINLAQQAFYQARNQFTANLADLSIGTPTGKEYTYDLTLIGQDRARVTAIPKRKGLKSYIGSVAIVTQANSAASATVICQSNQPSQQPPNAPQLKKGQFQCATNSSKL